MKNINKLMEDVNRISKIQFKLSKEGRDIYVSQAFKEKKKDCISQNIVIGAHEVLLTISKEEEVIFPLLEHYIKSKFMETSSQKKLMILDIIEGREVFKDELLAEYPFLIKDFSMIVIYVKKNIDDAFQLIEAGYCDMNVVTILYKDRIVMLGELDDAYEHTLSIKETLAYDYASKCTISYSKVNSYLSIRDVLQRCNKKISLVLKLNLRNEVIGEGDLIFEEIINSVSKEYKENLLNEYSKGFSLINSDFLGTIETFFECGLNISESANKLFIHRNTLIYRLDKIQKLTGFDMKNFNEAVLFKITLQVWKEENV